jgi:hypothetical protein
MPWWTELVDGLFDFLKRLGSKKTKNSIDKILKLVVLAAEIYEKFNRPLTGEEKARLVRLLVKLVKYSSVDQIRELFKHMIELKESGEIDEVKEWELDKIVGDGIALFVSSKEQDADETDEIRENL